MEDIIMPIKLTSDAEHESVCHKIAWEDRALAGLQDRIYDSFFLGTPVSPEVINCRLFSLVEVKGCSSVLDVAYAPNGWLLFSKLARACLADCCDPDGMVEYYPPRMAGPAALLKLADYKLVNIMHVIDAIDHNKSGLEYDQAGAIDRVWKWCMREDVIDSCCCLFRCTGYPYAEFASDELYQHFLKKRVMGVGGYPVGK
jgi:hypothetical protein